MLFKLLFKNISIRLFFLFYLKLMKFYQTKKNESVTIDLVTRVKIKMDMDTIPPHLTLMTFLVLLIAAQILMEEDNISNLTLLILAIFLRMILKKVMMKKMVMFSLISQILLKNYLNLLKLNIKEKQMKSNRAFFPIQYIKVQVCNKISLYF